MKWRKVYGKLKGNIYIAQIAEIGSLSSKNKNGKYLWCVKDLFIKYASIKPVEDKKYTTVLTAVIKIKDESNCKRIKLKG